MPSPSRPPADGVVVDDVEDLHLGAAGQLPGRVVELPALIGPLGTEAPSASLGRLGGLGRDEAPSPQHAPDGRRRRDADQIAQVVGDGLRAGVEAGVDQLLALGDDGVLDGCGGLVGHHPGGAGLRLESGFALEGEAPA
jgi:hypothetical protein